MIRRKSFSISEGLARSPLWKLHRSILHPTRDVDHHSLTREGKMNRASRIGTLIIGVDQV